MPSVSIIIPIYNVEKYIFQCLDSVVNQTFNDFEVILVDDGSPDSCPRICDEYSKKDSRFRVIHQANSGVSEARNAGIDSARGEWIYFVDADDWLEVDAIETLYREAIENKVDCIITDGVEHYSSGKSKRLRMFSTVFRTEDKNIIKKIQESILCHKLSPYYSRGADGEYPAPWTKFFKRSIIELYNIRFDPYVKGHYDDGLFTMYLLERVNSLYYDGKHTYNYRVNNESITRNFNNMTVDYLKRNCEKMDEFINKTDQNEAFKQAEYCRRVSYFAATLSSYYFSVNNPSDYKTMKRDIVAALTSYPFDIAFKKAEIKNFENKHKYVLICGRIGFIYGLKMYAKLKLIKLRLSINC